MRMRPDQLATTIREFLLRGENALGNGATEQAAASAEVDPETIKEQLTIMVSEVAEAYVKTIDDPANGGLVRSMQDMPSGTEYNEDAIRRAVADDQKPFLKASFQHFRLSDPIAPTC